MTPCPASRAEDVMRHEFSWRWTIFVLLISLSFLALPSNARAHSAFNYYSTSWGPSDVPDINWRFTVQVPPSTFRSRIIDGTLEWNNVSGVNFNWVRLTTDYANFDPDPSSCNTIPADKNGVHYRSLGSGVAVTHTCSSSGFLSNVQVVFNSNVGFYSGTGTTPAGLSDLWSFSAHEFGPRDGGMAVQLYRRAFLGFYPMSEYSRPAHDVFYPHERTELVAESRVP